MRFAYVSLFDLLLPWSNQRSRCWVLKLGLRHTEAPYSRPYLWHLGLGSSKSQLRDEDSSASSSQKTLTRRDEGREETHTACTYHGAAGRAAGGASPPPHSPRIPTQLIPQRHPIQGQDMPPSKSLGLLPGHVNFSHTATGRPQLQDEALSADMQILAQAGGSSEGSVQAQNPSAQEEKG